MDIWNVIFSDKLDVDDREPVASFQIPGVEGEFGLYPPRLVFWIQLTIVSSSMLFVLDMLC